MIGSQARTPPAKWQPMISLQRAGKSREPVTERLQDVMQAPRLPAKPAEPAARGRLGTSASVPRLGASCSPKRLGSLGNLPHLPRLRDLFQNNSSKHSCPFSRHSIPHTHVNQESCPVLCQAACLPGCPMANPCRLESSIIPACLSGSPLISISDK